MYIYGKIGICITVVKYFVNFGCSVMMIKKKKIQIDTCIQHTWSTEKLIFGMNEWDNKQNTMITSEGFHFLNN